MTRLPARVEPVKETMSVLGCATMASPTTGPRPVTMLNTPFGSPTSSMMSAKRKALTGATSLGLTTTVQPAASAARHLVGDLMQGIVPRRDGRHHADGLAHQGGVADLFFPGELGCSLGVVRERHGGQASLDPLASMSGMPTSLAMVSAISSLRSASFSEIRSRKSPRSLGLVLAQPSKAAAAASTARFASSTVPAGIVA